MSCGVSRDDLWEWLHAGQGGDGALGRHVAACEACRRSVAEMRRLIDDVREAGSSTGGEPRAWLPERIDEYRILRKIGAGGMGVVYEAEQQSPQRRVAVKVLTGALADEFHTRLFQREMQTLARLNHPGIAAIYAAGVTGDGQRYFAMELVEGVPLEQYASGQRIDGHAAPLTLRERLELFCRIGEAIAYAHQRGVIHRDLKPANILVTRDGTPKVLDFGLARAAESDLAGATIASEAGRLLGTPAYMSPEQTRAAPHLIDVRSDVYTLGVMLYELLTDELPYDVQVGSILDMLRVIAEAPPRDPRGGPRGAPREVGTILLKALEKSPARRYASVNAFVDDVQRYLNGYPILAHPPSAAYRIGKLVRRHKLVAGLVAAIFLLSIGSAVVFGIQSRRFERQRDIARLEAAKFQRINAVLTSFLNAPNAWEQGGYDTRVGDVLAGMERRIEDELSDAPLLAAAIRHTLGMTYRMIAEYEAGERHLRYAYETRRALLGERHPETIAALDDLGELLYEAGRLDEAEPALTAALAARRETLPRGDPAIAETLNSIGLLAKTQGRFDQAQRWLDEALAMRTRHAAGLLASGDAPQSELVDAHNAVAQTRNNLAALHRARAAQDGSGPAAEARLRAAQEHYLAALELRRTWLGEDHPDVAKMHNNYGRLLMDVGNFDGADAQLGEALAILERNVGREHAYTARCLYNLAELRWMQGRASEAEQLAADALAIQQRVLEPDHRQIADSQALLTRVEASEKQKSK